MNIKINGKTEKVEKTANIAELIAAKGLAPEKVVVEHNYSIVSKDEWPGVPLKEDDNIEIVSFVGGG